MVRQNPLHVQRGGDMVDYEFGSNARKSVEWRERLARFSVSGQPVKEFCHWESVSAASFYRWRRLLDPDDGTADVDRFIDVGALAPAASDEAMGDKPEAADGAALEVRLDLGCGLVLHIVRR
jgi:transposase-like protein